MSSKTVATFWSKVKSRAALFSWKRTSLDTVLPPSTLARIWLTHAVLPHEKLQQRPEHAADIVRAQGPLALLDQPLQDSLRARLVETRNTLALLQRVDVPDHRGP